MSNLIIVDRIITYSIFIGVLLCTASNMYFHTSYFENRNSGIEAYISGVKDDGFNSSVEFKIKTLTTILKVLVLHYTFLMVITN